MLDIKQYEDMTMLDLPEDERSLLSGRIDALRAGFDSMAQADTGDTQPLVTVLELCNILREDSSAKLISREELMQNAPEQQDGYFRVPATL
ncbi:MAG: Asp-tRNA(Asn)/Glu-tRNA(Gln) amidotransferase subunit GatC [Oscillospiraceae bacterium]|jgi:aspartyl-tRNA(Asn)/glutamyl-tRNA(Gln) amidotransferase subunit C|nr:Asp-tRNA(Asn)/Glu-tRNA(Gln) amidotransferase subunit GatC [Oscillospiraceae bacterium]